MKNHPQSSEFNERRIQHAEAMNEATIAVEAQLLLDYLIDNGFSWEEAIKLVHMREHIHDNSEVRQRMADDAHMQFARWLYAQGELNDN
jgi:uncharacterized protein Smg (DUF494 family)